MNATATTTRMTTANVATWLENTFDGLDNWIEKFPFSSGEDWKDRIDTNLSNVHHYSWNDPSRAAKLLAETTVQIVRAM